MLIGNVMGELWIEAGQQLDYIFSLAGVPVYMELAEHW